MKKEFVKYIKRLPIDFSLANISEYPLHWKDSIEILFVLKGTIGVDIESKTYIMKEYDIEILNPDEVFRISSNDHDNIVLILDINPHFFAEYYSDAMDTFYYSGSKDLKSQSGEKYHVLRRLIAILFYEYISKLDNYAQAIDRNLLTLMYHLLNNFHYLFYIEESLKDNTYQLQRYHRIVKYLSNNYMNKISLQDIAIQEFLNSGYLSFKIKDTLGLGFNDYLNQIRIEKSKKLLLDSDKSISEISDEVGFSHVRYYNKHFKMHYNMIPMQYRNKNKLPINRKRIKSLNLEEAIPYIEDLFMDYERYNRKSKNVKIDIDLSTGTSGEFLRPNVLNLGNCINLLETENRNALRQVQKHMEFKYCLLNNLFSDEMKISQSQDCRLINWTKARRILDFILEQRLVPIIKTSEISKNIIDDFIHYFTKTYNTDVTKWLDINSIDLMNDEVAMTRNPQNDTMHIVPYTIHSYIHKDNRIIPKLIDESSKDTDSNNDTFIGDMGLLTINNLKKPLFYAFWFLSFLGDQIIYKSYGCLVTKTENRHCILLYNPEELGNKNNINPQKDKTDEQRISLNIFNMSNDFKIIKFELSKSFGSVYDKWTELCKPNRIEDFDLDLLTDYTNPVITFNHVKKAPVINLITKIKGKGAVLYILKNL